MKNLLIVFTALLLFSCSSSSDDNNSSNSNFHPPAWIQGTWKDDMSFGYKFSTNDFCTIVSLSEICLRETLEQAKKSGANVKVNEEISENTYKFSYTVQGLTSTYHFIKISNTKIEFVNPTQGLPNISYIKQ